MKTSDINNLGNAYRSIYEAKTKEEVSDNKEFVPHMMYDPETGKGYKAEKPEDHERMSKMGYTHEEPDLVKEKKLPRQMLDPKKDVMVVKNNKVLVVDKSKEKEYLKKGWGLAEQADDVDERMKFGKRLKVGDIVYTADGGKYIKGKITKIIGKHDRDSGTFEVKLKSGKVVKRNLDQIAADDDIMEAVSPEQQAAIAINKKEKEEMKNEGSVKDLAMKIDKVVAKMSKNSKLKPFAKKFASMAMDSMDIEKSLEKALPSSVSGADMISVLEAVKEMTKMGNGLRLNQKDKKSKEEMTKMGNGLRLNQKDKKEQEEMTKLGKGLRLNQKDKTDEALDPVNDKENDKKFKDRKDKDIDNDGDVDDSDKYLHNRRATVDDKIDGGKKPAKKEEVKGKDKKKKLKASADANFEPMSDVAKSPKTAEIEKIGEDFIAMLEAALKSDGKDKDGKDLSKKAIDDEEIDDKESPKSKEFIKKHDGSDKKIEDKEEESHEVVTKAGSDATKPKSGKRDVDNTIGDTKVVNPVKEGTEEMKSLIDMARAHLAGENVDFSKKVLKKEIKEKNPYDGRMKMAKEFMQRMDKRRGITNEKKDKK
jgi:hypothetical protein